VKGDVESARIEPMILLPFLENAFKHAEKNKKENAIKVSLSVEAQRIYFKCENTFLKKLVVPTISMSNGLGNELIQKRISLLYGEHELRMYELDELYHVELILPR
jgi:LytS/YehU family sensor histidine kinase